MFCQSLSAAFVRVGMHTVFYYPTIMSFYQIMSRERAKCEAKMYCPSLTGLPQSKYQHMQKEQLWLNCRMFWILLPENRSQNNILFCSRITNFSFNGLAHNVHEHFAHC